MTLALRDAPRPILEALRAQLGPHFANEQQRAVMNSRAPEVLYSGAMGAGKSRILCEKAWWLAKEYPGATMGIFRKTRASLAQTTHRTFERDVVQREWIASRNKSEHYWELTNGSRIYFLGLDPDPVTGVPSSVGSLDLAWAGVDEAVECTEGDWIMLLGRLRDPRIPWHQLAAATNPADPEHWLKRRFTPATATRQYFHATARDNRFAAADYLAMLDQLPDNAIGRRLGEGIWSSAEGAIWHLPPESVIPPTASPKRVIAGIDWGFVHAFACEVLGQSGSGRLSVRAELYVKGAGIDQLVEPLAKLALEHGIAAFYCDPSEPGLMAELRRGMAARGCTARITGANNDVDLGIQSVDKAIRQGLTVDPSCHGLLNEIPGYTWAPNKLGGYHERPVDINDDACDALRYAVMAFEPDPNKPWASLTAATSGGVA